MNRLYTSLLAATALTFTAAAQQIPNSGFETWVDCIPWSPTNATNKQGTTPTIWTVSNVWCGSSFPANQANVTIAEDVTNGYSGHSVKLNNTEKSGKGIPGYITLGKPWSTAKGLTGSKKDGGTWGGYDFSFRPDAVSFVYQSTGTMQPSVIVYSWKGTYQQADVPATIAISGSPATCTMINRDRNILGISTSQGSTTITAVGDTTLISFLNARLEAAASNWTEATLDIPYKTSDTPEMINVIFAAGDYFSSDPKKDNSLTLDNFSFAYYSRLKSLSVNGTAVADFDPNSYEYSVDAEVPTDASAIVAECLGNSGSGKAVVALDAANNKATITVTNINAGGTDVDGESSHVYTLNFKAAEVIDPNAKNYSGKLKVICEMLDGELTEEGGQDATVQIIPNADNTSCTFLLPNFALGDIEVGDIKVEDVEMTPNEGGYKYYGDSKNMKLGPEGEIDADVVINGTIDADGKPNMKIDVIWHFDGSDIPINVYFAHSFDSSAIGGIGSDVIDENAPVEYYNIQGMKVNADNLTPGFYIVRQGKKVSKIFVK